MLRRRKQRQKERLFEEENPSRELFKKLTWSCHICNRFRPDNKISVVTKPIVGLGSGEVNVTQNIRYCNDNPECAEGAKTYTFYNLAGGDDV